MDNNNFNNDPNQYGASDYGTPQDDYSAPQDDYSAPQDSNMQANQYDAYGNNQQYNNQQYGYQQYGNQQYNQQYGNQQYGNQQYNNQQYNGYNNANPYSTNPNYNYSSFGAPVDEKGRPLTNRFGMKLTFSILEIISCNLISLIMGIIGCVFTTKANNAYKEGRWEDFKSAAKTATIVLWVGFGGFIVSLIFQIIVIVMAWQMIEPYQSEISDFYEYALENDGKVDPDELLEELMKNPEFAEQFGDGEDFYNNYYNDYYSDSDYSYEDYYNVPSHASTGEWYTFAINGQVYSVPDFAPNYENSGLVWEEEYYTSTIAVDDYELYYLEDQATGDNVALVWIANISDKDCAPSDGVAYRVNFENEGVWGGDTVDFSFGDGLNFDSSIEDIIAYFGEPDDEYHSQEDSSTDTYYWYMDEDYCGIEVTFYDGAFYEIYIDYCGN